MRLRKIFTGEESQSTLDPMMDKGITTVIILMFEKGYVLLLIGPVQLILLETS